MVEHRYMNAFPLPNLGGNADIEGTGSYAAVSAGR